MKKEQQNNFMHQKEESEDDNIKLNIKNATQNTEDKVFLIIF